MNHADFLHNTIEESGDQVLHELLPTVMGGRTQLGQVLQNLIANAIKFRHPDRPPQVHVSTQRRGGISGARHRVGAV